MAEAARQGDHARQAGEDRPAREPCSARSFHESLVHEAARADLAARRRGTASTLGRGEVSMTTAKAWRQKGTGRARAGALSVPHRRGGGAAFGPKPRWLHVKVNRKARRRALRSALSVHAEPRQHRGPRRLGLLRARRPSSAAEALAKWGARQADAGGPRRGGGRRPRRASATSPRVTVLPARRGRGRRRDRPPLADRLGGGAAGARGARRRGQARRRRGGGELMDAAPGDHRAGRLGEELRADGGRQVHVPRRRPRPQDPDPRTRSRRSSRSA